MMNSTKRVEQNAKLIEGVKYNHITEIIEIIKKTSNAKFNESIDLDISVKKSMDIDVKFTHGIAKNRKIMVFTNLDSTELMKSGIHTVGGDELIEKIRSGMSFEADVCFATSDILPKLVPIAKTLSTKKLMPNIKKGTVLANDINVVKHSVNELLSGTKALVKTDSAKHIRLTIGKVNFTTDQLISNIRSVMTAISNINADMVISGYISSTMGVGVKIPLKFLKG